MLRLLAVLAIFGLCVSMARAEVQVESITYQEGDTTLEGYIAYDDAQTGQRPGVLVVHQWTGIGDQELDVIQKLAKLGYVAMAADIYGKSVRPSWGEEAAKVSGQFKNDRPLLRKRAQAGLDTLKKDPRVDPSRTAAIGYCFGGMTVLELARSGADLKAVVSFHGNLDTPMPAEKGVIKAAIQVNHGGADPFVPMENLNAFIDEMKNADAADWEVLIYAHAKHSFTEKKADSHGNPGASYNEKADKRSWKAMKRLFGEVFAEKGNGE